MVRKYKKFNFRQFRRSWNFENNFSSMFSILVKTEIFLKKIKKILRTDFYFNRAKMYENDWWTERLPLLRPSAGFKPRKFPLHREKAWKVMK